MAYGFGTSQTSPIGLVQAGELVRGMVDSDKVSIIWPADMDAFVLSRVGIKVMLNAELLCIEALPRGGTVTDIDALTPRSVHARFVALGAVDSPSPKAMPSMCGR